MLTSEQIKNNMEQFYTYINEYISSPRKEQLLNFYKQYEERFIVMSASHKAAYHNCFPGGYIDHVNRVIKGALYMDRLWSTMGSAATYTQEELVFAAMNHDLGKWGDFDNEAMLPQPDEWRKKNLNEMYVFNTKLPFMSVPDRGIWILNTLGIKMSQNETLAIKLHDGLYDDANKPYLMSFMNETKPRTNLIYIIHQADLMAARIEWEKEWLNKITK